MTARHSIAISLVLCLVACHSATRDPAQVDTGDVAAATKSNAEAPEAREPPPTRPEESLEQLPLGQNHPAFFDGIEGEGNLIAVIDTTMGELTCRLFEKRAPNAVANFVGLARGLKPYKKPNSDELLRQPFYQGLEFHRVVAGFMLQAGDPTATGNYSPGYGFANELHENLKHDRGGLLSMANEGSPQTNGSQFFITEVAAPHLNGKHTIFGECDELELIKRMTRVPIGPRNKPLQPITINGIRFHRTP